MLLLPPLQCLLSAQTTRLGAPTAATGGLTAHVSATSCVPWQTLGSALLTKPTTSTAAAQNTTSIAATRQRHRDMLGESQLKRWFLGCKYPDSMSFSFYFCVCLCPFAGYVSHGLTLKLIWSHCNLGSWYDVENIMQIFNILNTVVALNIPKHFSAV